MDSEDEQAVQTEAHDYAVALLAAQAAHEKMLAEAAKKMGRPERPVRGSALMTAVKDLWADGGKEPASMDLAEGEKPKTT